LKLVRRVSAKLVRPCVHDTNLSSKTWQLL
jgi:hypothetical protein